MEDKILNRMLKYRRGKITIPPILVSPDGLLELISDENNQTICRCIPSGESFDIS